MKCYSILLLIALVLSCEQVSAAEETDSSTASGKSGTRTNLEITSSVSKTANGRILVSDTYTRNGVTNLVRHTRLEQGVIKARVQNIYALDQKVVSSIETPDSFSLTCFTNAVCTISLEFDKEHKVRSLGVMSRDGAIVEVYRNVEGVFLPITEDELARVKNFTLQMVDLLDLDKNDLETWPKLFEDYIQKIKEDAKNEK